MAKATTPAPNSKNLPKPAMKTKPKATPKATPTPTPRPRGGKGK